MQTGKKRQAEDEQSNPLPKMGSGARQPAEPMRRASHWDELYDKCKDKAFFQRIEMIYEQHEISFVVRMGLKDRLEKIDFPSPQSPDYANASNTIFKELIAMVENDPMSFGGTKEKEKLMATPGLVDKLRYCLEQERIMLESSLEKVEDFDAKFTELQTKLRPLLNQCEAYLAQLSEKGRDLIDETWPNIKASLARAQSSTEQENILNQGTLKYALQGALEALTSAIKLYEIIWGQVEPEIIRFRNFQKINSVIIHKVASAERSQPEGGLAALNAICFEVAPYISKVFETAYHWWSTLTTFEAHHLIPTVKQFQGWIQTMQQYIHTFLTRCFFIERNPHHTIRIIKEQKSKDAKKKSDKSLHVALWMFGGASYIIPKETAVTMMLVDEYMVDEHLSCSTQPVGDLKPNQLKLKLTPKPKVNNYAGSAEVDIMNFNRPVRDGKSDAMVTDSTYIIIFEMKIKFANMNLTLRTASLPIVFVSQSSQEWHPLGKHLWNSYFSEQCYNRYVVNPKTSMPWCEVAPILKRYCYERTERELSPDQLDYLAHRMFETPEGTDFARYEVVQEKFLKGPLKSDKGKVLKEVKSLWNWIHICVNLVANTMNEEWKLELIHGFISKRAAETILKSCKNANTFLLRFRESSAEKSQKGDRQGDLGICLLIVDNKGERRVVHGHTVERKDQKLAQYLRKYSISLTDGSIHPLLFVYPATPIREALEPFPEEEGAEKQGEYYGTTASRADEIFVQMASPASTQSRQSRSESFCGTEIDCNSQTYPMQTYTDMLMSPDGSSHAGVGSPGSMMSGIAPSQAAHMTSPHHNMGSPMSTIQMGQAQYPHNMVASPQHYMNQTPQEQQYPAQYANQPTPEHSMDPTSPHMLQQAMDPTSPQLLDSNLLANMLVNSPELQSVQTTYIPPSGQIGLQFAQHAISNLQLGTQAAEGHGVPGLGSREGTPGPHHMSQS